MTNTPNPCEEFLKRVAKPAGITFLAVAIDHVTKTCAVAICSGDEDGRTFVDTCVNLINITIETVEQDKACRLNACLIGQASNTVQ